MIDPETFPDDENGHVLRQLAANGADLHRESDVEFAHRAPDRVHAERFAQAAADRGYAVRIYAREEGREDAEDSDWDVLCIHRMVPAHHAELNRVEAELAALARSLGCFEDGWGFYEE